MSLHGGNIYYKGGEVMSEETLAEKLQRTIVDNICVFMDEVFNSSLDTSVKSRVTVDLQYSVERLALAVSKLQEAEQ